MVKKMSQKGVENPGDQKQNANNEANAENSNNSNETQYKINIKNENENEFIFSSPIKRIKKKIYFPSTPKKKKRTKKYKGLKIKGRNLSAIFELM